MSRPPMDPGKKRKILKLLILEKEPKDIAFNCECSITTVYEIRREFFIEKWVLRKHPKRTFNLES